MKNVLVTGANGHVGFNMVQLLVERGYTVRASVRDASKKDLIKPLTDLGVEVVSADIMKPETLPAAMRGIDGLFQIAAVYHTWAKDPQKDIIDPSVIGGINVLKAAKDAGVKKVVFTSSVAAISGDCSPEKPLTEASWNDSAKSPYTFAKNLAERKAWEFAKANNLNLVVINPSGVLGPGFYRHTPTTQVFEMVLRGQLPMVPPFGFSYVDVRDVAKAHLLAYEKDNANGRYIISDRAFTLMDLMKMVKEIDHSVKIPSIVIPTAIMPILPLFDWLGNKLMGMPRQITSELVADYNGKVQYLTNEKAKKELGWQPMDIKESIKDTLSWIRKRFINKN